MHDDDPFAETNDHTEFIVTGPKDAVMAILAQFVPTSAARAVPMEAQIAQTLAPLAGALGTAKLGAGGGKEAISLRLDTDWDEGQRTVVSSFTVTDVETGELRIEASLNMLGPKPRPEVDFDAVFENAAEAPADVPPQDENPIG